MSVVLCIAHLPLHFSSADLRQIVEPHARMLKCWVVHWPRGQRLGFGYVEVPTALDVQAIVIGLSGVVLDHVPLSITIQETA